MYDLLPHELIIDNFAGGGGTSTGLEQAFNRPVDVAINHDPNSIGEPLRTIPTRDRFGLVTVGQQQYQIVDIGFRMLQPVELFKAQGFPDSYIFEKGLDEHGSEIRLTKTEQTRMVGNSVCPQLSRALVEANFKHESKYRGAA